MLNCLCVVTHAILTVAPSREDWIRCYGNGFSVIANNENTGLTPCDRVYMSYQGIQVIDVNFAPLLLTCFCFLIVCCINIFELNLLHSMKIIENTYKRQYFIRSTITLI